MSSLTIERDPPLRRVRLDTGPMNVLGVEAARALKDAVTPDPEAPVLVLSGRGDALCAGLDNATLAAGDIAREELLAAMGELLVAALRSPTRIVAACAGHAVAAGAMLLLVADVRIGARGSYRLGFTEPRLGMPLPELPAVLARMRLDRRRVHELTVLGRTVGPEEAAAVGFLDDLVEGSELGGVAHDRARALAALSEDAYRGSLRSVWGREIERIAELVGQQLARRDAARAGVA